MANNIWSKGSFTQSMSEEEVKEKEKTIHKSHDEDMNYSCKECSKKISAHNKDWHDGMCDDCFNEKYFQEDAQIFETHINEIKKLMKQQEEENMLFLRWLKEDELDFKIFNKIVKEVTEKIDCVKCGNCRKEDYKNFPNLGKDITARCHQFFSNAEICPIVFNVLQNAKLEFEQELYEFENP